MSGSYPASPAPERVRIDSFEPSLISVSHSLRRIARSRGGQRWYVKMHYGKLYRSEWAPLDGFIGAQIGQYEKFTLYPAGAPATPRGVMAGAPLVNGAHAAGDRSIAVKGLTPAAANVWRYGDYIKFANHLKVYKVTADASADGAGQLTLSIMPGLIAALVDNEAITYQNVPMNVVLITDRNGIEYGGGLQSEPFDVEVVEDPYA